MSIKTAGFDMAHLVKPGTVISEVYFAVPVLGTTGNRFGTLAEALASGIARAKDIEARHARPDGKGFTPNVTVDVRWVMRSPEGHTSDCPAERYRYDTIAEAEAHLVRIKRYATV